MKTIATKMTLKETICKMIDLLDEGWDGEVIYDRDSETWSLTE